MNSFQKGNKIYDFSKYISSTIEFDNTICQIIWKVIAKKYDRSIDDILTSLQSYNEDTICLYIMVIISAISYHRDDIDNYCEYIKKLIDIIRTIRNKLPEYCSKYDILNSLILTYEHLIIIYEEYSKIEKFSTETKKNDVTDDITDDETDNNFLDIVNPLLDTINDEENALRAINMINNINKSYEKICQIEKLIALKSYTDKDEIILSEQLDYTVRDAVCLTRFLTTQSSKLVKYILIDTNRNGIYEIPKIETITKTKKKFFKVNGH